MKKLLFLGIMALTGCLWADRTANQGWVQKNFAPSNLVTRVKALEDAPAPTESDPVFTTWRNGTGISVGMESSAQGTGVAIGGGTTANGGDVAIGSGATSSGNNGVAIGGTTSAVGNGAVAVGTGANAIRAGAIQLGSGTNADGGTLKFKDWTLLDASGKIPSARLPQMTESDPVFLTWYYGNGLQAGMGASANGFGLALGYMAQSQGAGLAAGPGSNSSGSNGVALGGNASTAASGAVAIGYSAAAESDGAVQLGSGTNSGANTLQFKEYLLVDASGKIPSARLPAITVTEGDPAFTAWKTNASVAVGAGASASGVGAVQIGTGTNTAANTLRFKGYQLVDANGNIPAARLGAAIPKDATAGIYLTDRSKWYVNDSPFLAIGYKFQGHSRIPDDPEEYWACSPYAWNFSYNMLRVSMEGVDIGGSLLFDKEYEMMNYLGNDYETLDERIVRVADTSRCVRYVENEEFEDIAYALTKGVAVLNAAGTDSVAELREHCISCKYFSSGDEGTYFGERGNMVLSPEGPSISVDGCRHWMDFQSGKNGTIALTSDINAANVLTAIQAMTAEQKAALKTALGL